MTRTATRFLSSTIVPATPFDPEQPNAAYTRCPLRSSSRTRADVRTLDKAVPGLSCLQGQGGEVVGTGGGEGAQGAGCSRVPTILPKGGGKVISLARKSHVCFLFHALQTTKRRLTERCAVVHEVRLHYGGSSAPPSNICSKSKCRTVSTRKFVVSYARHCCFHEALPDAPPLSPQPSLVRTSHFTGFCAVRPARYRRRSEGTSAGNASSSSGWRATRWRGSS